MYEQEWFEELKLPNGVVCASGSLLSFFAEDTHADMRLENHRAIVSSVTNRKGGLVGEPVLDQIDNLCFLGWRYSACQNHIHLLR